MNAILAHRNHKLRRAQAAWLVRACKAQGSQSEYRHRRPTVRRTRLEPVGVHGGLIVHLTSRGTVAFVQVAA